MKSETEKQKILGQIAKGEALIKQNKEVKQMQQVVQSEIQQQITNQDDCESYQQNNNQQLDDYDQSYVKYNSLQTQERQQQVYYDKVKEMMRNMDLNEDMKQYDLRQIEIEEMYIGKLREQRQRMEIVKAEFSKKQRYIDELEKKVAKYDYMEEQYNSIKKQYNHTLTSTEDSTFEIQKMKKEIQMLEQKVQRLKNDVSEKDQRIQQLYADQTQFLKQGSEGQEQVKRFKQMLMEKETEFHLQLEDKNLHMQQLIEENKLYSQNKFDTDTLIYEIEILKTQNSDYEREVNKFAEMYQHERHLKEEIMSKIEKVNEQNNQENEKWTRSQQSYIKLINELQDELERHNQLLKKQEETISEFRRMKQVDDRKLLMIMTEFDLFQKEIEKLTILKNQQKAELEQYKYLLDQKEQNIKILRQQNQDLKAKVMSFTDNSIVENKIKKDLNKIKEDLISARNYEIDGFQDQYGSFQNQGNQKEEDQFQNRENFDDQNIYASKQNEQKPKQNEIQSNNN